MYDIHDISIVKPRAKTYILSSILALTLVLTLPLAAFADDAATQPSSALQTSPSITPALQFNLPTNTQNLGTLSQNLRLPAIDLPHEAVGSSVFNLDVLDTACITGQGSCVTGAARADLGLTTSFSTNPEKKIGLSLRPSAALRRTDDGSSAQLGGVVEFSKKSKSGSSLDNNTWYLFAGADAEAITYSGVAAKELTRNGFTLQDQFFVGDAKAGLGYRIGGADLSLSYLRRQATSNEFEYKEDAAALSFTWKR